MPNPDFGPMAFVDKAGSLTPAAKLWLAEIVTALLVGAEERAALIERIEALEATDDPD